MKLQQVSTTKIIPYENNAKIHSEEQIEMIKRSIEEFGFISPCLIDNDFNLIAGHGRLEAAKQLGMEKVPCVFVEGLTEEQRKAYILADNKLTEMGGWDWNRLNIELEEISIDMTDFGFTLNVSEQQITESQELDIDDYSDENFENECPKCGFKF